MIIFSTLKKSNQYDIPYADIPRGIELSLKNSDRHRTDAEILAKEKRYHSAIPLITLAVEEFGKALWLSEYFEKNASILHKEGTRIFGLHRPKINKVLDYVKDIVSSRTIKTREKPSEDSLSNIPEEFDEQDFKERMWYVDYQKIRHHELTWSKQSWKNPLYVGELDLGEGFNAEFGKLYYKYYELWRCAFHGIRKFRNSSLYDKILKALPSEEYGFWEIRSYVIKHFLLEESLNSMGHDESNLDIFITATHSWITPILADKIKEHIKKKFQVKEVYIILEPSYSMEKNP